MLYLLKTPIAFVTNNFETIANELHYKDQFDFAWGVKIVLGSGD